MSTDINISISNDALLKAIQLLAAANQQALDDRIEKTKLEQAADQSAQQTTEERLSAVPDIRLVRRPAAQRLRSGSNPDLDPDLESEYNLAFLNKYSTETVLNSQTTINPGSWSYTTGRQQVTGTLTCPPDPVFSPAEGYSTSNVTVDRATGVTQGVIDNSYSEFVTQLAPALSYGNATYALPAHVQPQTNTVVPRWLLRITNFFTEFTTICGYPFKSITFSGNVVSSGPDFPRSNLYPRPLALLPLLSSTSEYIHFTVLVKERQYNLTSVAGPGPSGRPVPYYNPNLGFQESLGSGTTSRIAAKDFTESTYGYYTRFNVAERTTESRLISFDVRFNTSQIIFPDQTLSISSFVPISIKEQLAANMYTTDPRGSLTGVVAALDPDINVFSHDPSLGRVYFHGRTSDKENENRYLYSADIPLDISYVSVFGLLKAAKAKLSTLGLPPEGFFVDQNTSSDAPYPYSVFTLKQTLAPSGSGTEAPIIGIVPQLQLQL
jgi:hypothetical protein